MSRYSIVFTESEKLFLDYLKKTRKQIKKLEKEVRLFAGERSDLEHDARQKLKEEKILKLGVLDTQTKIAEKILALEKKMAEKKAEKKIAMTLRKLNK